MQNIAEPMVDQGGGGVEAASGPLTTAQGPNESSRSERPARKLPASLGTARTAPASSDAKTPRSRKLPRFRDDVESLPLLGLPSGVVCCRHAAEADEHCAELERQHAAGTLGPLGFDIEWPVLFVTGRPPDPVATVQLAAAHDVYVFQVAHMGGVPPRLRALLENPSVPKAGVGISNDGLKVRRDLGVQCAGLLDLSQLAARCLADGARPWCLAELCERTLRRRLLKRADLRTGSNWAALQLSPEQVEYAALDACAVCRASFAPRGAAAERADLCDACGAGMDESSWW